MGHSTHKFRNLVQQRFFVLNVSLMLHFCSLLLTSLNLKGCGASYAILPKQLMKSCE